MELARGLLKKAKINEITACWKTTKKILYCLSIHSQGQANCCPGAFYKQMLS